MTEVRTTRRGVLLGAGAVGAGAVLVACGGAKTSSAPSSQSAGTSRSPSTTASSALNVSQVPAGGGVILESQDVVVTQPQPGTFKAFSATCTHQGCILADVGDGTIDCPCHGSKFSITDGSVVRGPATQPLSAKTVMVTGDTLTIT